MGLAEEHCFSSVLAPLICADECGSRYEWTQGCRTSKWTDEYIMSLWFLDLPIPQWFAVLNDLRSVFIVCL